MSPKMMIDENENMDSQQTHCLRLLFGVVVVVIVAVVVAEKHELKQCEDSNEKYTSVGPKHKDTGLQVLPNPCVKKLKSPATFYLPTHT